jgi:hypothetical protein
MKLEQRLIPRSLTSASAPGRSSATSVDEGVRASVMDPLWFLARQWQMGEFKAENCGSIASVDLESRVTPVDRVFNPKEDDPGIPIDFNQPVEPLVESENVINKDVDIQKGLKATKTWKVQNLEYQFSIGHIGESNTKTILQSKEYYGEQLDWYSFTIKSIEKWYLFSVALDFVDELNAGGSVSARLRNQFQQHNVDLAPRAKIEVLEVGSKWTVIGSDGVYLFFIWKEDQMLNVYENLFLDSKEHHVFPQPVRFLGMPKARWWQFEDEKIDLGDIQRSNLNYLSILLTEFALLYSNDWFILPVQQPAGSIRKVKSFSVYDVFGNDPIPIEPHVCSNNNGLGEQGFSLFSLATESNAGPANPQADSSILFLPNTLSQHIHGEALEEVIFSRDEMANLVWAIERRYFKGEDIINLEDDQAESKPVQDEKPPKENSKIDQENLPQYKIMSPVRDNWIPYISVQNPKSIEQIYFRRGRTKDNGPQYKTEIITNSTKIREEEIPTTPIVLTQNAKMVVYDSEKWSFQEQEGNGKTVLSLKKDSGDPIRLIWIGRKKNRGIRQNSSDLKFDYLIE